MIGVYSEINNITGISPHLEIESLVSVGRLGLWCTYKGTLIPCMLLIVVVYSCASVVRYFVLVVLCRL